MKKRFLSILIILCMASITLSACGTEKDSKTSESQSATSEADNNEDEEDDDEDDDDTDDDEDADDEEEDEDEIDPVAAKIMDDIDSIGEVELSDEKLIKKIEKRYDTLTDAQKEQVSNYADLLQARDELDELLENSEKETQATEKTKKKSYTNEEKACAKSIIALKNLLKNPESLQPLHYYVAMGEGYFIFNFEYSAQNGFGGANRALAIVTNNTTDFDLEGIATKEPVTGLYVISDDIFEEAGTDFPVTSEAIIQQEEASGIDKDHVNDLLEEYENTKNMSLFD